MNVWRRPHPHLPLPPLPAAFPHASTRGLFLSTQPDPAGTGPQTADVTVTTTRLVGLGRSPVSD